MPYYHVNDDFSKAWGVDGNLDWFVVNNLYKLIDDDEDWVITVPLLICQNWKTSDKIHQ